MTKQNHVLLKIVDEEDTLDTFYLINPDPVKLRELKNMIEHRFDYETDDALTDEQVKACESFNDNVWDNIYAFIQQNFIVLDVDEVFEIQY